MKNNSDKGKFVSISQGYLPMYLIINSNATTTTTAAVVCKL
jgi:hypothetical protein